MAAKQVTHISMPQMMNYILVDGLIKNRCHEVLTKLGVWFETIGDIEIETDGDRGTGDMFIFYYMDRESGLSSVELPISAFLDDKFLEEHIKAEKQRKLDEQKKREVERKKAEAEQTLSYVKSKLVEEILEHFTEAEIKALIAGKCERVPRHKKVHLATQKKPGGPILAACDGHVIKSTKRGMMIGAVWGQWNDESVTCDDCRKKSKEKDGGKK